MSHLMSLQEEEEAAEEHRKSARAMIGSIAKIVRLSHGFFHSSVAYVSFIYFVISVSDSSVSLLPQLLLLPAHTEKAGGVLSSAQGVGKRRSRKYARLRCRRLRVDAVCVVPVQAQGRAAPGKKAGGGRGEPGRPGQKAAAS